jgi:ankyrin repeat protein
VYAFLVCSAALWHTCNISAIFIINQSINQSILPPQLLIEHGASVNVRDLDGLSPSMWACRMDHIDHFELLSQVEDQNIEEEDGLERDFLGRTWMHWSIRRQDPHECLKTLLTEDAASIKDKTGKTVIHTAAELGKGVFNGHFVIYFFFLWQVRYLLLKSSLRLQVHQFSNTVMIRTEVHSLWPP